LKQSPLITASIVATILAGIGVACAIGMYSSSCHSIGGSAMYGYESGDSFYVSPSPDSSKFVKVSEGEWRHNLLLCRIFVFGTLGTGLFAFAIFLVVKMKEPFRLWDNSDSDGKSGD